MASLRLALLRPSSRRLGLCYVTSRRLGLCTFAPPPAPPNEVAWLRHLLVEKQRRLDDNQRLLEENQRRLDDNQRLLEEKQRLLEEKQRLLEEKQRRLDDNQRQFEITQDVLKLKDVEMCRLQVDILKVQGLNNTRGLYEHLQEMLMLKHVPLGSPSRGQRHQWTAILSASSKPTSLIKHLEEVTHSKDTLSHVAHMTEVYAVLSDDIHAGRDAAKDLQAVGGAIVFQKGPLSPHQVRTMEALGNAANMSVKVDPNSV